MNQVKDCERYLLLHKNCLELEGQFASYILHPSNPGLASMKQILHWRKKLLCGWNLIFGIWCITIVATIVWVFCQHIARDHYYCKRVGSKVTFPLPTCFFSSWGFPGNEFLKGMEEDGGGRLRSHSRPWYLFITRFRRERVKSLLVTLRKILKSKTVQDLGTSWQDMLQASLPRSHPHPIHTNAVTTFTTFSLLTLFHWICVNSGSLSSRKRGLKRLLPALFTV